MRFLVDWVAPHPLPPILRKVFERETLGLDFG